MNGRSLASHETCCEPEDPKGFRRGGPSGKRGSGNVEIVKKRDCEGGSTGRLARGLIKWLKQRGVRIPVRWGRGPVKP